MRIWKRTACFLLAAALCCTTFGCGGGNEIGKEEIKQESGKEGNTEKVPEENNREESASEAATITPEATVVTPEPYTPTADRPVPTILTEELLAMSQAYPVITAEDHPAWNGFLLADSAHDGDTASVQMIRDIASWGFNSVYLLIDYDYLFESADPIVGNSAELSVLDRMIAAAIEEGIHISLCLSTLPGRHAVNDPETFTSKGEFDLFINPEQQRKANAVWQTLAARYSRVSNYNLSICPFWESTNTNLSTGLIVEDYTQEDIADYLAVVVDAIRQVSPDRLIVYNPGNYDSSDQYFPQVAELCLAVAKEKGNMIAMYNVSEHPFVYAHMTGESGQHIDNNNHSAPTPSYPTYYYALSHYIDPELPMILTGCLPAGTVIDLYLGGCQDSELEVLADGEVLYEEELAGYDFATSHEMSGLINYATSDKKISVTLSKDTEEVRFTAVSGAYTWCGMDVFLPEEYAKQQWYYASEYDVYLGLQETDGVYSEKSSRILIYPSYETECNVAVIHEDLTFTTDEVREEASADTISEQYDMIKKLDSSCILLFGGAFSGVVWDDLKAYYSDVLDAIEDRGLNWWCEDIKVMTYQYPTEKIVARIPVVPYSGYKYFNREMLELFQAYLPEQ